MVLREDVVIPAPSGGQLTSLTDCIGPRHAGMHLTVAEFDAIADCEEGYVYELINEVLVVSPPPLEAERDPNEELGHLLRSYQELHPNGKCLDKTLSEQRVLARNRRRADRVLWIGLGRKPRARQDVPTIVVEFVSEGRRSWQRDYVDKRDEYLAAGVQEYWIIDRFARTLTVHVAGATEAIVIGEQAQYETPLLPGFVLPLARLLTLADGWED